MQTKKFTSRKASESSFRSIPLTTRGSAADSFDHLARLLQIEVSYKYTRAEALSLFHLAGFRLIQTWTDSSHRHSLYLVERQSVFFPSPNASKYLGLAQGDEAKNVYSVPSLDDWETMFRGWNWLMVSLPADPHAPPSPKCVP